MKFLNSYILLCIFFSFGVSQNTHATTLRLTTEHYPPYNIDLTLSGDEARGAWNNIGGMSTEIVAELMRRANYSYTIDMLSWKRAYGAAQKDAFTGVFSTTRTEQREELFKWVGPVAENNYVLLALKSRNLSFDKLGDAAGYRIGAYKGSAAADFAIRGGLNPDLVRSDHLNPAKLNRDRIDAWITGEAYGFYLAKQNGVTGLSVAHTYQKRFLYIAFNKETPDEIIDNLNMILKQMKAEGFVEAAYQRYR